MRLSIVIPTLATPDRLRTLDRALVAIFAQAEPADEVVVVQDTVDGDANAAALRAMLGCHWAKQRNVVVAALGAEHGVTEHDWGHSQVQLGMQVAGGEWLLFQDDDDVVLPGALAAVRAAIACQTQRQPLLFRFISRHRETGARLAVWRDTAIRPGNVGGHSIVVPNDPARRQRWGRGYTGDYEFVRATVAEYRGEVTWRPELLFFTRP